MTKKQNKPKRESVKQFMVDYFKNIDFDYWEKRLNFSLDKILKLKKNKSKSYYVVDIYSIYLQLLEIFFINVLILSSREKGFLSILFINNTKLRKLIKEQFGNLKYQRWLMDKLVFGIKEKRSIKDYSKKREEHLQVLKEGTKDYLKDYEFLNAYKHGYRIQVQFGPVISIDKTPILKMDAELIYFTKKGKIIYQNRIMFNLHRILAKSYFILGMLKNCQKVFLAQGKAVNLQHYFLTDIDKWQKAFGVARLKEPLFCIEKIAYEK